MSTQLVDDRQLQVEEILGAFDLPVGGTHSGVAYGGRFIQSGTGAMIETRDPSTGNVLAHVRSASEADCSSAKSGATWCASWVTPSGGARTTWPA